MALAYLMDQHVRAAITRGLRLRGIDAVAALEDGSDRLEDEDLLLRATELGRILFTHDDDLLAIAHRFMDQGRSFAGVIYAHQLRVTVGGCIRDLELISKTCSAEELVDHVEFLPL